MPGETRENLDHLPIADLAEAVIEQADRAERLIILEAHDLVDLFPQLSQRLGRSDGHCENQFFRLAHAGSAQGRARRSASGDAIVDHDSGASAHVDCGAIAEITTTPTF